MHNAFKNTFHFFAPTLLLLAFFGAPWQSCAQTPKATRADTTAAVKRDTVQIPVEVRQQRQPRDFDFSFVPATTYRQLKAVHKLDTLTKGIRVFYDTTGAQVAVKVEKIGNRITVSNLFNTSEVFFAETIKKFEGLATDNQTLVYTVEDKTKAFYLNPNFGFLVVLQTTCEKWATVPTDCDQVGHFFGAVPVGNFMLNGSKK